MSATADPPPVLYTIGHSNHTLETFLGLLRARGIEALVDTRSQPYSRYTPHFNRENIERAAVAAGMRYVFLGRELGGRPEGAAFYDAEGHVLYGRVAESPLFLSGAEKLEKGAAKYRVAIFCSEEDPSACHRRLLIARVLSERGMEIRHIRADGSVPSEAELQAEEMAQRHANGQQALFGDDEVKTEWRSIRSVLPGKQPPSSSAS